MSIFREREREDSLNKRVERSNPQLGAAANSRDEEGGIHEVARGSGVETRAPLCKPIHTLSAFFTSFSSLLAPAEQTSGIINHPRKGVHGYIKVC